MEQIHALTSCYGMQLQKDGDWETRVDAAFGKLDSNGDGYIDLEELLAQLPFESEESYDGERLMEVIPTTSNATLCTFENFPLSNDNIYQYNEIYK